MSLLPVGFGASGDDYEITDSLRFRDSASASLTRTPATAPTNAKKFTFSFWAKLGIVNNYGYIYENVETNNYTRLYTYTDGKIYFDLRISLSNYSVVPTRVFRDPSAWYHIVWSVDTTQATASDRVSIYINGVKETSFTTANYPAQNGDTATFNTNQNNIGQANANLHHFDGYLTEFHGVDGQALDADDFGEYDANGTWKAKEYTGTHGTNGFYLPMKPTTQADGFNTVLYTGDGTSVSVANTGYAPDFVWIKNRDDTNHHRLYDTVRGSNQMLSSSQTAAEQTKGGGLTSFDSDGFSVGNDGSENNSGDNFVAWTWDAGDNQPSTGISSVLYSGSGIKRQVNGFGFSPDLVWIKNRLAANFHYLYDSVRGVHKSLSTNSTGVEDGYPYQLESFDSDGFTVGNDTAGYNNYPGRNYIAWGWDAGDGDPVTNTDGSITSTVKASDATGFSIVTYSANGSTGTIGHGLSSAPELIIVKKRNAAERWTVYHQDTSNAYIYLNENFAAETANANLRFGNNSSVVAPTSSVFTVGNSNDVNGSGGTYVAYCFSEVSGVSKFDTYTGNGSTTGPVVTTGFRPGFVMTKRIDSTSHWMMFDTTRNAFNPVDDNLYANLANAENNDPGLEVSDTGFQLKAAGGQVNVSSGTYIYMAFKGSYSDYVSPLNDTGTIDSRVKANNATGFSIVSVPGQNNTSTLTVGHGLSTTPDMIIGKSRNGVGGWAVWHKDLSSANHTLFLNSTSAESVDGGSPAAAFSAVSSSTITIQNYNRMFGNGVNGILYAFSEVSGVSKIDSYTGNGSTTGPVVTTGFRPAFVMIKSSTNSGTDWLILDGTRSPNNTRNKVLFANSTSAEAGTGYGDMDVSDTGFQIKTNGASSNASGQTYIYMAFADTADAVFNFDASGNKNNFDANNINSNAESETTYDLMKDTPSLVDENAANFATLNPLTGVGATFARANMQVTHSAATSGSLASFALPKSNKWYWESTVTQVGSGSAVGILSFTDVYLLGSGAGYGQTSGSYTYRENGQKRNNSTGSTYGATYTTGDVIGIAYDADNDTLTFYKNGTSQGVAWSSLTEKPYFPVQGASVGTANIQDINFGQRPFAYTPPTGFLKLNTFNLPDSTIEKGSDYFNTVTFSGNGSGASVTGVGFQPDFIWAKNRTNAYNHELWDAIRGVNSDLASNNTSAEITDINRLVSFDSDGFSYGTSSNLYVNGTNSVAWNWKANGSGVLNEVGDIDSTVSANTTAGFSIATYTAPSSGSFTVGHGLGVAPAMIITKSRNNAYPWGTYHQSIGNTGRLDLNSTAATVTTANSAWQNTSPTSTVFTMGSGWAGSGITYVAYCFAPVEGYSSFGSYTGNGSTDGPFVYTGFRPAFVMVKVTAGAIYDANWFMLDSARGTYNVNKPFLAANNANAENSGATCADFLSNGFKLRITNSLNDSNATYIYMAFAENPFKNALAR